MCVLLRGVWSLKKARLRCDRLCWWPLNFNTLHNYTCIIIDKVILPRSGEISHHLKVPAQQAWTWAGLRPIRTIGFDKPPGGRTNRTVEKQRASCKSLSWFVTLLALGFWRALEHLLNSARNFSACSRSYLNFVSTPTKPTIYSKAKARRHNIKE